MTAAVTGVGWAHGGGLGRGWSAGAGGMTGFQAMREPPPDIRRRDVFATPYKDFGRMDPYSRLGLAAVALALEDAGLADWRDPQHKRPIGLIAATVYGCLHTDIDYYRTVDPGNWAQASPALFTYTLPNCFLGDAAIRFGLTGPAFVVNETAGRGLTPVVMAAESLAWGEAEHMLCGVCDLGRPAAVEGPEAVAGALFFMLEAPAAADRPVYGRIALDGGPGVMFEERRPSSVLDLAAACLERLQELSAGDR